MSKMIEIKACRACPNIDIDDESQLWYCAILEIPIYDRDLMYIHPKCTLKDMPGTHPVLGSAVLGDGFTGASNQLEKKY